MIQAATAGNYNSVIDIIEHPFSPIGPNEVDPQENITATYAAILASLNLEQPKANKTIQVIRYMLRRYNITPLFLH